MIEVGDLIERVSDGEVLDVGLVIDHPDGTRTYVCRTYPFGDDWKRYTEAEVRLHPMAKYGH